MAKQTQQPVYEEQSESTGAPLKIILAVAFFGLALMVLYISFAKPEPNTSMGSLRNILRGLGGSISPLLSLVLVWIGVLQIHSAQGKRVRVVNTIMNSILFLCAFTAVHLFFSHDIMEYQMKLHSFPNFISKSYQYGKGGGLLGALMAYPLYNTFGPWAGLLGVMVLALICLLATGRAQQFYRWLQHQGQESHTRSQDRHARRVTEQTFGYDEFDSDPRQRNPQRPPQPRQQPQPRPANRRPAPADDYMIINSQPARPEKSAAKRKPARPKLYQENIDPDVAVKKNIETTIEIPKPLRTLKQDRQNAREEDAYDAPPTPARSKRRGFQESGLDFFAVESDNDNTSADSPSVEELSAEKPAAEPRRPAKPAKRVVEGVRALTIDGIDESEAPEEEDDAPFDIPHTNELPKKVKKTYTPVEDGDSIPYAYPPFKLLQKGDQKAPSYDKNADIIKAQKLIDKLEVFDIETRLVGIAHGPKVTCFELLPAPDVKVNRIAALENDIKMALAAETVRIEAPIPGKEAVGVEVPNDQSEFVYLRDVLESPAAKQNPSKLLVGLGKDNSGRFVVADIAKMPHVLVAGETGAGKSGCINSIILSLLYRASPDEVRLILIDPKMVELSIYNDIPHLIAPVVNDPEKAAAALDWAVAEMTKRYKLFTERSVKNINGYNKHLQPGEKALPRIVIIIDELNDLMMVAGREVENSICRLTQLARAAGIHLIVATQQPTVNVITGVIKANIPTRIAFKVASQSSSTTILNHKGAEQLLGAGDMLFYSPNNGVTKDLRIQGSWVDDEEIEPVVEYIKKHSETYYDEDVVERIENSVMSDAEKEESSGKEDPRLAEAIEIVINKGEGSVSYLQTVMEVGHSRALRLMFQMEERGIVGPYNGSKPRKLLITREQFHEMFPTAESFE